jgi:dTDP-4-amino-4,6-dideoxygalactose transaminase
MIKIPFTGIKKQYNNLRQEILDVTDEVLRSGQVMSGNWTEEFEHWLARKNRCKWAITCHSGTQALEIIAEFLRHETTDAQPTVAVPSMTYVATINAWLRAGWDVILCDVDSDGIMDLRKLPDRSSINAMCLVGLYGHPITHHGSVRDWQKFTHIAVIEDAAQHWISDDCGRIGSGAAISFDPMKNLSAYGNGGAVVTNDPRLADYARAWRDNGKYNRHRTWGTNSRISEIDAAHLMVKTRYLDQWQQRRAKIAEHWIKEFRGSMRCLITEHNLHEHALHKFVIDVDHRDDLEQSLLQAHIEARVHYRTPLHEIPEFHQFPGPGFLSSASALSRRVLSLPFYPELTDLEVEYITESVKSHV